MIFALIAIVSATPRDDAIIECNATDLYDYLAFTNEEYRLMEGMVAVNESCNCDTLKATNGQFCYYDALLEDGYAAVESTQFCEYQAGTEHTYEEIILLPNYHCLCYDPVSSYKSYVNLGKTICDLGESYTVPCANVDGSAPNTDQLGFLNEEQLEYKNLNYSTSDEEWHYECECGDGVTCAIGGRTWSLGPYCNAEQYKCSSYPSCAADVVLDTTCQCGHDVCKPWKEVDPMYCTLYPKPADADYAKDYYSCETYAIYENASTTVYVLGIIPPFILVIMLVTCVYYRWWLSSISDNAGKRSKGGMQVEA